MQFWKKLLTPVNFAIFGMIINSLLAYEVIFPKEPPSVVISGPNKPIVLTPHVNITILPQIPFYKTAKANVKYGLGCDNIKAFLSFLRVNDQRIVKISTEVNSIDVTNESNCFNESDNDDGNYNIINSNAKHPYEISFDGKKGGAVIYTNTGYYINGYYIVNYNGGTDKENSNVSVISLEGLPDQELILADPDLR